MEMEKVEVYPNGTLVEIKMVDMNAFCGRDNHPQRSDKGLFALIQANYFCKNYNEGSALKNVTPGEYEMDEDGCLSYEVLTQDGRKLDMMWCEIEKVPE